MPRFGASDVPHTTQTDHRILRRPERPGRSAPDGSPPAFGELMIFGDRAANLSDRTRSRARSIFLAQIADDLGNRPAAEAALKRLATVVREAPDDVEALDAAARCAAILNRPDDAVNYWRQALKAAPNEEHVLDRLSQYLARTNRLQAALDVLDRLIGINQWSADVHFRRSNVLAGLNRLTEALRAAERGIALDPSRPHYHDWLADMYRRMGRTEDGRRAGDTARKLKARQNQEKRTKQP
jgi:tetratricopeptide (TPR) repeat protein